MRQPFLTSLFCLTLSCGALVHAQNPSRQALEKEKSPREAIIILARQADYFEMTPVYGLLIYPDGSVAFIGQKNVKTKGLASGRISQQDLQRLVSEFEKINYFSLSDRYERRDDGCPTVWADASSAYVWYRLGEKRKSVTHYLGCGEEPREGAVFVTFPKELYRLENMIDEVTKSKQWIE